VFWFRNGALCTSLSLYPQMCCNMAVKILEHYIFPLTDCVFNAAAFDILIVINIGCKEYSFQHIGLMSMSRYLVNSTENLNCHQKVHGIVTFNCSFHHPQHETHINTFIDFHVICCYQMMVMTKRTS